jgi:hypothetical protein
VVGIQKHRRLAGGAEPFAVGIGIGVAGLEDGDVLQAGVAHLSANLLGALVDFLLMFQIGADAGDGDEVGKLLDKFGVVSLEPIELGLHGHLRGTLVSGSV